MQPFVSHDTTEPRRFTVTRDQLLIRLWEIAAIGPEVTRGSLAGQIKALSMIVAIEGLIPDRRAASAWNQPAPPPAPLEEPTSNPSSASVPSTPEPAPAPTPSFAPRVPMADYIAADTRPDTRVPFSIKPRHRQR